MKRCLLVGLLLALSACGGNDGPTNGSRAATSNTLTVLAASSLTGTFEDLADVFEADHPGVTVKLSFDSSATLAMQAAQGAPADVLATADEETMQSAVDAGVITEDPVTFAENEMVLVVPADNPAAITDFADVAGTDFVVCVDTAPCGKVAAALLEVNGITAAPASEEVDVKSVLAKVVEGEADAGLVYETDLVASGDDVLGFDIPGSADQPTQYFTAPLEQSADAVLAQDWIDLLASDAGQSILVDAGFIIS